MKIDLNKSITGVKKEPIKDKDGELTLKRALLLALIQPNPDPRGVTPDEAIRVRKLFDRIDEAEQEIELKSEEVVKLKNLVARGLSEVVAGAVIMALEPE